MKKQISIVMTVALVLAATAASNADTISLSALNGSQESFTVSSSDLLQTNLSSAGIPADSGAALYNSTVAALYNGIDGDPVSTDDSSSFTPSAPTTVVFQLDTTTNANGYDINKIVSLSGYCDIRTLQAYSLSVAKVGSSTYSLLYSVDSTLTNNTNVLGTDVQVTAIGSSGGAIASGIGSIKVEFLGNGSASPETVYREMDVFGSATTIPEPSTLVLMVAGLVGLLAYAWRKRK